MIVVVCKVDIYLLENPSNGKTERKVNETVGNGRQKIDKNAIHLKANVDGILFSLFPCGLI